MIEIKFLTLVIFGYLLGSIPFGLILSKFKNIDIRASGSGNIGATNVSRVLGKKLGILTLILDSLKGVFALYIAKFFETEEIVVLLVAVSSVIGHIFPVWLNFKGGKGVATGIAVIFVCNYKIGLVIIIAFLIVFTISKIVSLSSIISFATASIYSYLYEPKNLFYLTFIISFLVIIKHYTNILRILNNTENKFK
ncbi:MAG: glycerol-3-phosphate 1-O-acyltransferase PlsY [Alphaproteobacteria bacterium]